MITDSVHEITLRPTHRIRGMSTVAISRQTSDHRVSVAVMSSPALAALDAAALPYRVIRHGPVTSLAEAAAARGVAVPDVVKTIVVRRGEDDHLFVLTPGDRVVSWPKLRALLGVSRLSMPDAEAARAATGYERGTITPFGSTTAWPVVADERLRGREITLGAGEPGVAVAVDADAAVMWLGATVADVTDPEPAR
jgi:Cys-tRNA(Pro)/Cys-tRNA(Cys) deacylase